MSSLAYIAPSAFCLQREAVMDGTMEGPLESSEAVQKATALIEQRLAQEEESEVGTGAWRPDRVWGHPSLLS